MSAKAKVLAHIGCAGWSLRAEHQGQFPLGDSHLARYAGRFNAVEINSSFYRRHLPSTYQRWHDCVPATFLFSVKIPKAITHQARLVSCDALLRQFLHEVGHLRSKLGCLLVQLPPSLAFDAASAEKFFSDLRARTSCAIVCEPRHLTWQRTAAMALLEKYAVGLLQTDLERAVTGPFAYYRLHGTPVMYTSSYSHTQIDGLASQILTRATARKLSWCIFDNTASGAATLNALALSERLVLPQTASLQKLGIAA